MEPTLFENVLKVWHTLNVGSRDISLLSKDGVDLTAEFLQGAWISHKKTTV